MAGYHDLSVEGRHEIYRVEREPRVRCSKRFQLEVLEDRERSASAAFRLSRSRPLHAVKQVLSSWQYPPAATGFMTIRS
jgi:hypothetical protein